MEPHNNARANEQSPKCCQRTCTRVVSVTFLFFERGTHRSLTATASTKCKPSPKQTCSSEVQVPSQRWGYTFPPFSEPTMSHGHPQVPQTPTSATFVSGVAPPRRILRVPLR